MATPIKIRKFLIKILRLFFDIIINTKRGGQFLLSKFFKKIIAPLANFFFNTFLIPVYKTYLKTKNYLIEVLGLNQTTNLYLVSNRKNIHIVVIFLTIITVIINSGIGETRAEGQVGQDTILSLLVKNEQLGQLVEKKAGTVSTSANRYDEEGEFLVENILGIEAQDIDNFSEEDTFIYITTDDESVIVKPEIPSSKPSPEKPGQPKPTEKRDGIVNYVVEKGDVIGAIARKFGLKTDTILWANNLTFRSLIRPGDKLIIPPIDGVVHIVKKGETLLSISNKYKANLEKIIAYNKLAEANSIAINQEIFIPGGEQIRVAVTPTVKPKSKLTKIIIPDSAPVVSSERMLWPTPSRRITQYFTWKHSGLDVGRIKSGVSDPPIYAADDGVVVIAKTGGWNGGYGNYVVIKHGNGNKTTLYGHLSDVFVGVGDEVQKGQTIGLMGNTGRSTGIHLHFEVRFGKTRVNPLKYVSP